MADSPDHPSNENDGALRERIAVLEARVEALAHEVEQLQDPRQRAARQRQAVRSRPATPPKRRRLPRPDRAAWVFKSEDWLGRIGIGLLLFGLAFLFKYSVEQGWIGPMVRLGFGVVLGGVLLGTGLRFYASRRRYGQGLMGGGIAVWYATTFAAFQLYALLSYGLAFALMVAVTALAFLLAVRQKDAVMAVIATQGGLGTPFLLFTADGSIPGLVVYTLIILGCALALYLVHGWRTLLASAVIGGWLVFGAIAFDLGGLSPSGDRTAFLVGIAATFLLFGGVPLWRAVRHHRDSERWARPPLVWFEGTAVFEEPVRLMAVAVPLVSWLLTLEALDVGQVAHGAILAGVAVLLFGLAVGLRREELPSLASAHAVSAVIIATLAGFYLFDDAPLQLAATAGLAALVLLGARRWADRGLWATGQSLLLAVLLVLFGRLLDETGATPVLVRPDALLDLASIVLVVAAAWTLSERPRFAFVLAAYAAGLSWLWRDLVVLPNGQAYVSVAWGVCALALVAVGARRDLDGARWTGLGTLLLVVAKLFAVDLAELDAIWRILLFLGFGALLLVVSYAFPSLWRVAEEEPSSSPE